MVRLAPLDRKLVRDLWRLRGQVLTIALVVASGLATFVTMRGALASLALAMDRFYAQQRFPHVFAHLERAPDRVVAELEAVPGIERVETRVVADVRFLVEGGAIQGRLVSAPRPGGVGLAAPRRVRGRLPEERAGGAVEVAVTAAFAEARGLVAGDRLRALVDEREVDLLVVGTVTAPEYVAAVPPGGMIPDDERYGVGWVDHGTLAALFDMEGAFNDVVATVERGASLDRVLAGVDRVLDPHGGLGAIPRDEQLSHWFLRNELTQLGTLAAILPAIFLSVAAFLFAMVLGRLIQRSRGEIAVLKAFGYGRGAIGLHFAKLAAVIAVLACALGLAAGTRMCAAMVGLYGRFFRFPDLRAVVPLGVAATACGLALGAAAVGAAGALRSAMALAPADAMRPPTPPLFRSTWLDRAGRGAALPLALRVVLRSIQRSPGRSAMVVTGVAAGGALLLSGLAMVSSMDRLVDLEFRAARRADVTVSLVAPRALDAVHDFERLPGVREAEPFRMVAARLRAGVRSRRIAIEGRLDTARMHPAVDRAGRPLPPPPPGLVLTETTAAVLGVGPGDTVTVEVLEGERRHVDVPVAAVHSAFMGLGARMELGRLCALVGDPPALQGVDLAVDPSARAALDRALALSPAVASSTGRLDLVADFDETTAENMAFMTFFLVLFACVLVGGVVYNNARVALAERGRDLASMRVLGYRRREVATFLVAELGLLTVLALPLAFLGGYGLARGILANMDSELIQIPLHLSVVAYGRVALVVLVAAAVASWLVARDLARLDLVEVLKIRD